jgi:hypothetical protein
MRKHGKPVPWYKTRAAGLLIFLAIAIIAEIISSPAARIYFGALIVCGFVVALVLYYTEKDDLP